MKLARGTGSEVATAFRNICFLDNPSLPSTDERNSAFLRQLPANGASYWNFDNAIRFYYGLADEAIHPERVARALSAGGKFAHGVPVDKANHRTTFLAGLSGGEAVLAGDDNVLSWFTKRW